MSTLWVWSILTQLLFEVKRLLEIFVWQFDLSTVDHNEFLPTSDLPDTANKLKDNVGWWGMAM